MQARTGLPDIGDELLFDGHVNVFIVDVEDEIARLDALAYTAKAGNDSLNVVFADDTLLPKHVRMGNRSGDILLVELFVNGQRCSEPLCELAHVFCETT